MTAMATIKGTNGNDSRNGTSSNDLMYGYDGNDTLDGKLGSDTLYGGSNNDTLYGDLGADTLSGGFGTDYLSGGAENDSLLGESGNDTLNGGTGNDTLNGGTGNDAYYIKGEGTDLVTEAASAGTDTVQSSISYTLGANLENLTLTGSRAINGTGNTFGNQIIGNDAANVINGGLGNDTIDGNQGNDFIDGGEGNDILSVANTYEYLGESADLQGGVGDDTLYGGRESRMNGGIGNDVLFSGVRDGSLDGGDGDDILQGRGYYASMFGGNGNDTLTGSAFSYRGGEGNDSINLSTVDTSEASGGGGSDRFIFDRPIGYYSSVIIDDFNPALDLIEVSASGFGGGLVTGPSITAEQFRLGSSAQDASDRFIYESSTGILSFDVDGSGATEQSALTTLVGGLSMTNNDIFVV